MSVPSETRTLSSYEAFASPWFTIRHDEVEFVDGSAGHYYVMERTAFSAVVATDDRQRICLINAYRHPIGRRVWELPQGSEDLKEPQETAALELEQEAGLQAESWTEIGEIHEAYGYSNSVCTLFHATELRHVAPSPEPGEGNLKRGWFTAEQFWALVASAQVTDAVTIAAVSMATRAMQGPR